MSIPDYLDIENVPEPRKDFKPNEYNAANESSTETGVRGAIRSAARFGEGVLGAYGEAQNLRKNVENAIIETGTSFLPESAQGIVGEGLKVATKGLPRYTQEKLVDEPFGSNKLFQQVSNEITQGYTKPQNDVEKGVDEVFTMAGNLALGSPAVAGQTFARKLFTDLGLSALNKTTREGVKLYGGGDIAQHAAGLGAMILATFLGRANPRQIASDLYNLRDSRITPQTTVNAYGNPNQAAAGSLYNDLQGIRAQLTQGGKPAPAESELISQIDTLLSKVNPNGEIPVQELTKWQYQLNRLRQNYPQITFDNRLVDPIRQANQRAIGQGLANDPIAYQAHREANEAFAAGAQAHTMSNFIQKWIPKHMQSGAIGALLGHGLDASRIIPGAAAVGTAASALWAGRIIRHVMQSPVLRREYGNLLNNIGQENIPAAINSANKLHDDLEKDKKLQKELDNNDFIDIELIQS